MIFIPAGEGLYKSFSLVISRLVRDELQCHTVVTVALTGRFRTVVENMPVVSATACAMVLGAWPDQFEVTSGAEGIGKGRVKARPAGATIELGLGAEQRMIAGNAEIDPLALFIVQRAGPGFFGTLFTQHVELGWGEACTPLFFAEHQFFNSNSRRSGENLLLEQGQEGQAAQSENKIASLHDHLPGLPGAS